VRKARGEGEWNSPEGYFALEGDHFLWELWRGGAPVWEALDRLGDLIRSNIRPNVSSLRASGSLVREDSAIVGREIVLGASCSFEGGRLKVEKSGRLLEGAAMVLAGAYLADDLIEIGPGALVETGAMIKGPTMIGAGTEVRQGAYVRGSVLSLEGCVIGHATEAKNALLLKGAKAGHFAYLGDSILGSEVNLGAGTKLANLKILNSPFRFEVGGAVETLDRRKLGAILGDGVQTGCNSVTSPGVLLGPGSMVLPNATVKGGWYGRRSVIKPAFGSKA
jgi:acetyltransferase-like isoleucine patch superfamily enzyme